MVKRVAEDAEREDEDCEEVATVARVVIEQASDSFVAVFWEGRVR